MDILLKEFFRLFTIQDIERVYDNPREYNTLHATYQFGSGELNISCNQTDSVLVFIVQKYEGRRILKSV